MRKKDRTSTQQAVERQVALLAAQVESLARDNERLAAENARMAAEAAEDAARIADLQSKMERLVEQIKMANMRFFGSKSERVVPDQLSLFNDMEAAADPSVGDPEAADAVAAARPRRRGGRRRLDTSRLERVVVEHVVECPECPECGSALSHMKVEVTEVVRLVPARLVVEEHRRSVYRCDRCCAENAEGGEGRSVIVRAPMPALTPIPRSFATASLVAGVIDSKYTRSTPLYRLEDEFRRLGADISRANMANWVMGAHERWLSMVHSRMREKLLTLRYLHADETEVQVLREPGREAESMSRMWLFRSGAHDVPICIYEYHPTRSGQVARDFLEGWSGYLTTDGYEPYYNLGIPGVVNVSCLVHARRKYAEIVKVAGGDAAAEAAGSVALEARRMIDEMFRVDRGFRDMPPDERKAARLERLRPLMLGFEEWARGQIDRAVPRLDLHKALAYSLKYWPYVMNVLEDGNLALDNNIAERAIKPFVIGRKNWLFSNTPRGAAASAAVYSIVVTAKLNGLNQRSYVEWLLTEMPNDDRLGEPGRIDRYLPWSDEVPGPCRLGPERAAEAAEMKDEPIVDGSVLEAVSETS